MPTEASNTTPRHRYLFAAVVLLVSSLWSVCHAQPAQRFEFIEAPLQEEEEFGLVTDYGVLPPRGHLHVLVIFAQFTGEAPAAVPEFATRLFDPDRPGSFTHFYTTMSFGQLQVQGTVLPKRYTSDQPDTAYRARDAKEEGQYGQFVLEVLQKVDAEIDLGLFDNDGSDGLPNSGDDDGRVDYVFINLQLVPENFIWGKSTGVAGLGFSIYRSTTDTSANGKPIRINGGQYYGTILKEGNFAQTVGSMTHEFGHSLGLPDLYDRSFLTAPDQDPSEDGAGIGAWCLMGRGVLGWNEEDDGPNPLCAWSREQLRWTGRDNEHLVEIRKDTTGLEISSLYQQGAIYKISLEPEYIDSGVFSQPYLLVEQRTRDAHYYDRHLPGEGLLIWHVRPSPYLKFNDQEEDKYLDLVCADGLYADAGFPLGRVVESRRGRDNLDFWARDQDSTYRVAHSGNLGDATDPFDGVHYTRFDSRSNPSSNRGNLANAYTGVAIELHRQGETMSMDVSLPRWAGTIREEVHWTGDILVDGDLTIAPEGKLIIHSHTQVRFAGADRLHRGADPSQCEIQVQGELRVQMGPLRRYSEERGEVQDLKPGSVVFEALVPGETWYGIQDETNKVRMPKGVEIRDAEHGLFSAADLSLADPATAVLEDASEEPVAFALLPNYPNPFDQQTTLRYTLAAPSQVHLGIYSALGQTVRTLVDDYQPEGLQQVVWDGRDESEQEAASGVYLYRLEVPGKYTAGSKMLLLRSSLSYLAPLDTTLQARGADWSALRRELVAPLKPAFGVAAKPSTPQAAFTAGSAWLSLSVPGQDPQEVRSQLELLRELLLPFAPSPAQLQAIDTLSVHLRTGPASPELFDQGHRAIAQLLQTHSAPAATYFYLGEWLQSLRAAGLVARHLDLPLSAVVDLSSSAAIGRQFSTDLGNLQADERTVTSLDHLATLLEANPRSEEAVKGVLELLEDIADPLTIR